MRLEATGRTLGTLTTLALLLATAPAHAWALRSSGRARREVLSGTVVDTRGTPVVGARVFVVEAERAVLTDARGGFSIPDLAPGPYTVEVRRLGYRTELETVVVPATSVQITLVASPVPVDPVNVTVARTALAPRRSPLPVSVLGEEQMDRDVSFSLARTLERLPGIRDLSTGQEIGKPVIRGLRGSRVLVLADGLRLEDYSWSDEDGPAADPALADRVEVIRGPASVMYGADAVGGVINVVPAPLPDAAGGDGFVTARVESHVATNNREGGVLLSGEGATGAWGWRATVNGSFAEALHTPEGELENTGFGAANADVAVARRGSWGSLTGRFTHHGGEFKLLEEDAPPGGEMEGEEEGPERKANDERAQLRAIVPIGDMRLEARAQGQLHHIIELEDDPTALPERVEVEIFDLTLKTGIAEALLHHSVGPGWSGTVGATGQLQSSATGGLIPIIPGADLRSGGVFVVERYATGPLTLLGGLRAEAEQVEADGVERRAFSAVTWSAGASWSATPSVTATANLGKAWRAPNLFESYASGPRLGEGRYEIGRSDLDEETSLNADVGVRLRADGLRGHVAAYRNDFDSFVYAQPTTQVIDGYQVFRYQQADAVLEGVEGSLAVDAGPAVTLSVLGDYVRGTNQTDDVPLPLMPPPRVQAGVEVHGGSPADGSWRYVEAEIEHVPAPRRLNPDDLDVDGYTLVHAGAGVRGRWLGRDMSIDARARNLLNESYRDFLSRYKSFALDPGRDVVIRLRVSF